MINIVEYIYSWGFLNCDIKPENELMGLGHNDNMVSYILCIYLLWSLNIGNIFLSYVILDFIYKKKFLLDLFF
ncbi:transmembrane protein, putative [Medicago truncatula]|uniref:Transmembrane protein, putative n=1 Tax=Medicago truncatula TaxID=3880 RepID=G7L2X8_MEDTR|nr:transmembrane protein, putative [Medicago truncatula]